MKLRLPIILGLVAFALIIGLVSPHAQNPVPNDRFYSSKGAWGQEYNDQWGLRRIGFTPKGAGRSAWDIETGEGKPVIVAVLDSGIDYFHPDLRKASVWRNPREQANGKDDDGNGLVDDLIGWNFVDRSNNPWDHSGHGTFVAGLIAAAANNGTGIAGINWGVQIMPIKVMNFMARGHGLEVDRAIIYAVSQGARVINLSVEANKLTLAEQLAVDYAYRKGVLVVVAAGNQGSETTNRSPVALRHVLAVAATDPSDKRAPFSNWGPHIKIAAPGIDLLSLRARETDFILMAGAKKYKAGEGFVGPKARLYRASGTSFAAPLVSGVASLLFAKNPKLTVDQVTRIILHSARDIDIPGVDQHTGYGLLDARAALSADPEYFVDALITGVKVVQKGGKPFLRVLGTVNANELKQAWVEIGTGEKPTKLLRVSRTITDPVKGGALDDLPDYLFAGSKQWTLQLVAEHQNGKRREARFHVNME